MEDITIYADKREGNSKILDILKQRCNLVEQQLEVGDYLLSKRVCVERKTTGDFISSILDQRLFAQISEMKRNFENPVLIIEGNGLFRDERKVHPNAIRGALASVSIDYGIPVIHTENNLETAEMLLTIAKREQLPRKSSFNVRGSKRAKSMNDVQEILLAGLPNVNTATAKSLLKHFGSPEKVFAATESQLMEVGGIGPIMAKRIRTVLSKRYERSILE